MGILGGGGMALSGAAEPKQRERTQSGGRLVEDTRAQRGEDSFLVFQSLPGKGGIIPAAGTAQPGCSEFPGVGG